MLRTRVIPCLLLKDGLLYKTVKFRDPKYVGDPINAVKIFNEKEVDELLFLDIAASQMNRKPNFGLVRDIASEAFMPVGYGGGVASVEDAATLFSLGVEKVVVNSNAFTQPDLISRLADRFGSQSVVVSIDCRKTLLGKYDTFTHGGTRKGAVSPHAAALEAERCGAGEIVVTSIDRDGTGKGYDVALLRSVTAAVKVPVVASGGAASLADMAEAVRSGGASAVAAGSMFVFHGKHRAVLITYPVRSEIEAALC
jgi:cyclase